MSETENKGDFLELQKDESQTMSANPDAVGNDQGVVKENTEGYSREQPPASNPGSGDPSGGIPSGSGGVSSAASVGSPVESSKPGVVESTVESVRNYLGNLSILGGPTLAPQETKTAGEGSTTSTGSAGGTAAGEDGSASTLTATATTPAAAVRSDLSSEEQTDSSSKGTSDANKPDSSATSNTASTAGREGTKADSELKAGTISQDDTRAQDETQTKAHDSTTGVSSKDDTTPAIDDSAQKKEETAKKEGEPLGGVDGDEGGKKTLGKTRENESAIPTAGGERLGEKHWGESKMVPDVPKKEGENVSSKDGQPDQQTKDNTARNIGGSGGYGDNSADSGEGKQKLTDKIKDKLPFGKKD